ncbi:interleukin-1 receptor-associated kinase 1 isoform X2 [Hippoglossus hippoglossus]|uniref:interleukin-1 receptor-associated kinase 1 isoform X2 n=1 Tax=Hippoglossus hippoglossus TaxID=8267 RepID=UPI00148C0E29|nr:interleukin-1 receptor-associated kinase 1 isoform X2 [Hippoglossus hippoglossus]
MSGGDLKGHFIYKLPSSVLWDFCRVMDGLSDLDWTRFASEVLCDQTEVRLAERKERRTDWVMNQWGNRNGRVWELIDLLERLQLFRQQDVILNWTSTLKPLSYTPPPPPPPPPPQVSSSQFDAPPEPSEAPRPLSTRRLTEDRGGRPLPRPAPPPSDLRSDCRSSHPEAPPVVACGGGGGVMCWSYEEVHAGTKGFSPSLQVGEGGFGVVYRATLGNTDCAIKKLKQDCVLDLAFLKQTFQTEVEKLSKFRHPNIVDLLGVCEGGGSLCLIYSYMDNRSLEEQLHNCVVLTWCQRLSIVEDVSSALAFLHSPPDRHAPLIHGDVKSSNILLDRHLVAKLADFGLARFGSRRSTGHSATRTASVGKTETVRGTLAYLPEEYWRNGELGTAVDVYSFGVVLLEVLTGRRALERDGKSGERYLKDLVEEVEDSPTGSCAAVWKNQLDQRLITGGAAEPAEWMTVLALACICLDKRRKKRPGMSEVFQKLKDVHNLVTGTSSSSSSLHHPLPPHLHNFSQSLPRPPLSIDSRIGALTNQISKLGPLKDTNRTPQSSSSSFVGPCETDESQGFSQFRSDRTSSTSLSTRDQHLCGPSELTSVPTEDQDNFSPQSICSTDKPGDTRGQNLSTLYSVPECLSPAGSLQSQSSSLGPSGTFKCRNEQRTQGSKLLSSDDLYGEGGAAGSRGPEESDELDYLPAKQD